MPPSRGARADHTHTRSSSVDSSFSMATADANTNATTTPITSSTPPTETADMLSISSTALDTPKFEQTEVAEAEVAQTPDAQTPGAEGDNSGRARRTRPGISTYNLKVLSGTAIHSPFMKNGVRKGSRARQLVEKSKKTPRSGRLTPGETLVDISIASQPSNETLHDTHSQSDDTADGLNLEWSVDDTPASVSQSGPGESSSTPSRLASVDDTEERRKSTRRSGGGADLSTQKATPVRRTSRFGAKRELKNLEDTPEFKKEDKGPVIAEVWSNGKLVTSSRTAPVTRRSRLSQVSKPVEVDTETDDDNVPITPKKTKKKEKTWLNKGLYAGQTGNLDWFSSYTDQEKQKMPNMPTYKPNGLMPLPMWHGQRLLHIGRNFKLPFDVCSPLPPGQPKPDEWKKTTKNRFIGDAASQWKKEVLFDDFSSKCVCTKETACDEDCQNRIMLYECDEMNCSAGPEYCTNRAFSELEERRRIGGKYRIGVEVIKTEDRGYGVRSNRCFEPNQIIVEYTGEIITEEECDRRMNEDYKDNEKDKKCYYLMSFDQNMIIDATRGSIARFVNHSCDPNCRMVKWVVAGKPRMALFAGDKPIMSGDELTYDYNFDPFSAKNVQQCRCGSENCRGVLGPKPKDRPKPVDLIKDAMKASFRAGKRKMREMFGGHDEEEEPRSRKKRKISIPGITRNGSLKGAVARQISNSRTAAGRNNIIVKRNARAKVVKPVAKNVASTGVNRVKMSADGTIALSKDGKRKSAGWGGKRVKGVSLKALGLNKGRTQYPSIKKSNRKPYTRKAPAAIAGLGSFALDKPESASASASMSFETIADAMAEGIVEVAAESEAPVRPTSAFTPINAHSVQKTPADSEIRPSSSSRSAAVFGSKSNSVSGIKKSFIRSSRGPRKDAAARALAKAGSGSGSASASAKGKRAPRVIRIEDSDDDWE